MKAEDLSGRLLDMAIRVLRVIKALPKSFEARHIAQQLLRAAPSPGANYEEACGAESRADFGHKMGVVLKELKESRYWLRLISRAQLIEPGRIAPLLEEVEQLIAIFARSIKTVRTRSMTSDQ